MAHISPDFKTRKAFLEYLKSGGAVYIYAPGLFPVKEDGIETVEAPAQYHKWYCRVEVKGCRIVKVLK